MIVGQGPIALKVGAGGGCLDIFYSPLAFLSSFSLSLGDASIWIEINFKRVVNSYTTSQPPIQPFGFEGRIWNLDVFVLDCCLYT